MSPASEAPAAAAGLDAHPLLDSAPARRAGAVSVVVAPEASDIYYQATAAMADNAIIGGSSDTHHGPADSDALAAASGAAVNPVVADGASASSASAAQSGGLDASAGAGLPSRQGGTAYDVASRQVFGPPTRPLVACCPCGTTSGNTITFYRSPRTANMFPWMCESPPSPTRHLSVDRVLGAAPTLMVLAGWLAGWLSLDPARGPPPHAVAAGLLGPDWPCMLVTYALLTGPSLAFIVLV